MHPYAMKGFTGTVTPYPYFNAKTDAEALEAALILRRGKSFLLLVWLERRNKPFLS